MPNRPPKITPPNKDTARPRKATTSQRGYDWRHQKNREVAIREARGLCQYQGEHCTGWATEAHHLRYGPDLTPEDYRALCPACHREITRGVRLNEAPPEWAVVCQADHVALAKGCYWDRTHGDRIVNFANHVFAPQYVDGSFKLLPWQERFLRRLYSWRQADGTRRFKTCNLHISKKQGKTLIVAIVSAYEMVASGTKSPFVVTGSVSRDNAGQVFAELRHCLETAGLTKGAKITPKMKTIYLPGLNSTYVSLASDGDRVQGYNCSFVGLDELHSHKSSSIYDSLRYAHIARPNGFQLWISTAGDDPTHFYYDVYRKSKRVLAGEDLDVTHMAEVYEMDPDGDPMDPAEWERACPSMGVSFQKEQFKLELEAAKESNPAEWYRFQRYRLNRWCRPDEEAYFDVLEFDRHEHHVTEEELVKADCWCGVDLSLTTDPSSISCCWHLGEGRFFVRSWGFVAREGVKLRERTSLPKYQEFEQNGRFTITDGERIDDKLILEKILELCTDYNVRQVIFDPSSAMIMAGLVEAEGFNTATMTQSHRSYNQPLREFHRAIGDGRILHDGNKWLRYCLGAVRVDENRYGEIRPHSKNSIDHIDGAISTLLAYSQAMMAVVDGGGPGVVFL